MDHPNVVTTLGIVPHAPELVAVMEYVPGASLAEIAAVHGAPIDPHVAIAAGALRGLQAVDEARGCDAASGLSRVSADRILVGEDGTVRVLHFGVPGEAQAGEIVRALPYASPEQLLRQDIDVRRDRGRTLRRVPDRGGVARHGTERRRADARTA